MPLAQEFSPSRREKMIEEHASSSRISEEGTHKLRKATALDLFAGAGGFSLGIERAGFSCVGAVERDMRAGETYARNFLKGYPGPLFLLGSEMGDVSKLDKATLEKGIRKSGVDELDLLLAGPPCQGFSKVGRGKLDHLADKDGAFKLDPRNKLYLKFLDVLEWTRPRAFLFENVPGLLHFGGGNEAETICEIASAKGYRVLCALLNAAWYGVPQTRERVFIFGIRMDQKVLPSFPAPLYRASLTRGHLTARNLSDKLFRNPDFFSKVENPLKGPSAVSVEDAFQDLPTFNLHLKSKNYKPVRSLVSPQAYRLGRPNAYATLMRQWNESLTSQVVTDHFCRHTPRDHGTFALMNPGDKYPAAVKIANQRYEEARKRFLAGDRKFRPVKKQFVPPYQTETFDEKWRKLIPEEPSWTVTAHLARDCYSHIHYDSTQKRAITVREAARIQSFPDAFQFCGHMGDCFKQIGNAVPPLLAFHLGKHILKLLRKADRTKDAQSSL